MFEIAITCKLLVAISPSSNPLFPNYFPASTKLYKFMVYTQPLWRRAFRDVAQAVDWVKENSHKFQGNITFPVITWMHDDMVKALSEGSDFDLNEEQRMERKHCKAFGVSSDTDFVTMITELGNRQMAVNVEMEVNAMVYFYLYKP